MHTQKEFGWSGDPLQQEWRASASPKHRSLSEKRLNTRYALFSFGVAGHRPALILEAIVIPFGSSRA